MSEAINNQKYEGEHWSQVSDQLKELLAFMVQEDRRMRFTVEQVLNHPWIKFGTGFD